MPADSTLAAVRAVVVAGRRQRVELDDLWAAVEHADPWLRGSPQVRQVVREVIDHLVDEQLVQLPGPAAVNWDRREPPELPRWVRRPARARPVPPVPRRVWPAVLEPAAAVARGADLEALGRIADWLREHAGSPVRPVPVEERSVQVFGDEKRLKRLAAGRLFTDGRLTLELLGCRRPPLPLGTEFVPGTGPPALLLLENAATYSSCLAVLRGLDPARRPATHVGWGRGKEVAQSLEGVLWLDPRPHVLRYFGDLDVAGLQIGVGVADAGRTLGLPVEPAEGLYALLLDRGRPVPDGTGAAGPELVRRVAGWFPVGCRQRVLELLDRGERIAQEHVGLEALTADPTPLLASLRLC